MCNIRSIQLRSRLVLILGLIGAAPAATHGGTGDGVWCMDRHIVAHIRPPLRPADIQVQGQFAYVSGATNSESGFCVYDVSDALAPVLVGQCTLSGPWAARLVVHDDVAYVSTGTVTAVVEVSNPMSPQQVGAVDAPLSDAVIDGDWAYVVSGHFSAGGLRVLDVSNPLAPVLVTTLAAGSGWQVSLRDHRLYIASSNGVRIFDVSNPAQPVQTGAALTGVPIGGVAIDGETLCATAGWNGDGSLSSSLWVMSLANPTAPEYVAFHEMQGWETGPLTIADRVLYVQGSQTGVRLVDISNPALPRPLTVFNELDAGVTGVSVTTTAAYISTAYAGLLVADISNLPGYPIRGELPEITDWLDSPVLLEDRAYGLEAGSRLKIWDTSDLGNAALLSETATPGAWALNVSGGRAYVFGDGFKIFDVSDAAAPTLLGTLPELNGFSIDVDAARGLACVTTFDHGQLVVIDVSDPAQPRILSTTIVQDLSDVRFSGQYAVCVSGYGLYIFDLGDPAELVMVSAVGDARGRYVEVEGDRAYVQAQFCGGIGCGGSVSIIDISDVRNPVMLGTTQSFFEPGRLAIADGTLVLPLLSLEGATGGLALLDVRDPSDLSRVAFVADAGSSWAAAISGSIALVANEEGATFVDVSDCGNEACPGDLDSNRAVGLSDLAILLSHFGEAGGTADGDLDGDAAVGLSDLALLLNAFGSACD
ncbi:MAG: hypothetical protein IT450_04205 [Phycisphaerales bacterium]|nr:hypothetical protein [Phycisphaerales bacterium]